MPHTDDREDPADLSDMMVFTSCLGTRAVHARHFDRAMAKTIRDILDTGVSAIRFCPQMAARLAGRLEALALLTDSQALLEELAEEPDEEPDAPPPSPPPCGPLELALSAATLGCAVLASALAPLAVTSLLGWTALLPSPQAPPPRPARR